MKVFVHQAIISSVCFTEVLTASAITLQGFKQFLGFSCHFSVKILALFSLETFHFLNEKSYLPNTNYNPNNMQRKQGNALYQFDYVVYISLLKQTLQQ